ncbi:MAG: hypothetical protein QM564_02345 [Bergeyella sp.]
MKTQLLLFFFFAFHFLHAQKQYLIGKITNEFGGNLSEVTIYNLRTDEKTETDLQGNFLIQAKDFDEIRFIKKGYERISKRLSKEDFSESVTIVLFKLPHEIEEVEISFVPTGKLEKDIKYAGGTKETQKLKSDMADYIAAPSTREVLAPKHGEFVQPVGAGFSIGKVDAKWDDVDFMNFLIENLGDDFFIDELKLKKSEIQPFIYYVFRNFERKKILFNGFCPPAELSKFIVEATMKIDGYRKNLPNNPPPKKKRKK